jgi:hypothetical protein
MLLVIMEESLNAVPKVIARLLGCLRGYSGFLRQWRLGGWAGISPITEPSTVAVLGDLTWVDQTCRGVLRKPSILSGWGSSFTIQLSSQQQVRMISTYPTFPFLLLQLFYSSANSERTNCAFYYANFYVLNIHEFKFEEDRKLESRAFT